MIAKESERENLLSLLTQVRENYLQYTRSCSLYQTTPDAKIQAFYQGQVSILTHLLDGKPIYGQKLKD